MRYEHIRREWLGNLPTKCTALALDHLSDEYRGAALGLLAKPSNPIPQPTSAHVCIMPAQYGLVCFCEVRKKIEVDETHSHITPITLEEIDPFWYTGEDLALDDPLLRIREPRVDRRVEGLITLQSPPG
jgi:hypothetical protein